MAEYKIRHTVAVPGMNTVVCCDQDGIGVAISIPRVGIVVLDKVVYWRIDKTCWIVVDDRFEDNREYVAAMNNPDKLELLERLHAGRKE